MMPREHLVGTIHGSGADAMLLIEFSGEGVSASCTRPDTSLIFLQPAT
jgi:hypothetical protein